MNLEQFSANHQERWNELDLLVSRAKGRAERLGPDEVLRLGRLYRATAADLAVARREFPNEALTVRLDTLVGAARSLVYRSAKAESSFVDFVKRRYWWQVRSRPWPILIAALALLGPMVLVGFWAHSDPVAAASFLPEQFGGAADGPQSDEGDLGLSLSEQGAFSTSIFVNNIRVSFLAWAGGITLGIVTVGVLIYNGSMAIGLLGGLIIGLGGGDRFFELVAAHGFLELSLIIVAGAAGLRLGWSIIDPGHRPRGEAVLEEARASAEIALGTAFWLVIAGLIEGFVTPRGIGLWGAIGFGIAVALLYWGLVIWLGRPKPTATDPR